MDNFELYCEDCDRAFDDELGNRECPVCHYNLWVIDYQDYLENEKINENESEER